jgi:hypothetical protein
VDDRYIDGIGQVSVQGATVRIELTNYSGLKADKGKQPDQEVCGRISMSLRTLVSLQKTTDEVVSQLIEKGILKKKESDKDGGGVLEVADEGSEKKH